MMPPTRAHRMADLARDLRRESDATSVLDFLVEECVNLVDGCELSAITVALRGGRRVDTPAASSDLAVRGDVLQGELGEGPCVTPVWDEEWIRVGDLGSDDRWPAWGPRVRQDLGVRSMLCLRLFTHEDRLGFLTLYSRAVDAFSDDSVDEAVAVAAHAAVALAAAQKIDQLGIGLARRTMIGQAVGITMERYGLDADRAFSVLVRLSSHENRKLFDIAADIVADRSGREDSA